MRTLKTLLTSAFNFGAGSLGLANQANAVVEIGPDVIIVICASDGTTTICNSAVLDL
jgi:hypothetical protein